MRDPSPVLSASLVAKELPPGSVHKAMQIIRFIANPRLVDRGI